MDKILDSDWLDITRTPVPKIKGRRQPDKVVTNLKTNITPEDIFKFIKLLLLFKKIFEKVGKDGKDISIYSTPINILINKYAVNCGDKCDLTEKKLKDGLRYNSFNRESNKFKELNSNVKAKSNTNAKEQFHEMLKEYNNKYKLKNEIPQIN